ncbi:sensor histidine kinase [Aquibium sp. ELW1220]|uniref:sensor histidine kinase n=1 Tax=Aquibium sp. ELW1220 TaxID=2976766 RepID=UPI0025B275DD|nr:sensor histidine kinase [Aquibium sp. ELW1220]MDN2583283.1 sensor histidine kinase [Aquibium sp. ELW1220]
MQPQSETVHILAPAGRDAENIRATLAAHGLTGLPIGTLAELAAALCDDTGAILMTEEAAARGDWGGLVSAIEAQPAWSAYPFIFIVSRRQSMSEQMQLRRMMPVEIVNMITLERPMSSQSLVSAVRWALNGRRRQYQVRDHLVELEAAADRQRLMTRELAHRVKNTIAVLQSIASQTLRRAGGLEEVERLLLERFSALARAHDLLLSTDFQRSDFRLLLDATLSVHLVEEGRMRIEGPDVDFSPQAALTFALVVHELATNAMKYGALSHPGGAIDIAWCVARDGGEPRFDFRWKETTGKPVAGAGSAGFGTRLIKASLGAIGEVSSTYAEQGLVLTFSAPLGALTHGVVAG